MMLSSLKIESAPAKRTTIGEISPGPNAGNELIESLPRFGGGRKNRGIG